MGTYKAVLFDLFHTLVDVASAPGARGRYTADILGVGRDEWNRACFSSIHDICRPTEHVDVIRAMAHSLDRSIPESRIREATAERQQRFDHALCHVEEETLAALGELRALGYRLALVSNASSGEVSAWRRSPLAGLFDEVVFSWECGARKPQPAIYEEALRRLAIDSGQGVFVGDGGSEEHRGAHEVGLDTVFFTRYIAHYSPQRLAQRRHKSRWEAASLQELAGLLYRDE